MNQDELVNRLQKASDLQEELASMSNDKLADLLLEVWADMELFTYNSELLDVIIQRMRSGLTTGVVDGAKRCPECDSEIIVCIMGHCCGEVTPRQ